MSLDAAIVSGLEGLGLPLSPAQRGLLCAHLELVAKWNRVHNLTAVRDTARMVGLHALDSLSVVPHLAGARTLLDVGSGAGFPGIPIAIARPDIEVTLLDSSSKKCAFLEQAKAELGLANVRVACERAERWRPAARFDAVVSRAFAELADFIAQASHLAAPGGRLIAMKGVYPYEEIGKLPATCRTRVIELAVPTLEAKRHLVTVEAA